MRSEQDEKSEKIPKRNNSRLCISNEIVNFFGRFALKLNFEA